MWFLGLSLHRSDGDDAILESTRRPCHLDERRELVGIRLVNGVLFEQNVTQMRCVKSLEQSSELDGITVRRPRGTSMSGRPSCALDSE